MKGIILAGGAGTRLYPSSLSISKILLPIYDKPMIYYPLATLMMADIKDILVITNEADYENFKRVLGDGKRLGMNIQYKIQYVQRGIADAFIIAEDFINGDDVVLILGDNIFYGKNLSQVLKNAKKSNRGATVFGYPVDDPERFGVAEIDDNNRVISLEEKPAHPKSNYAVTGLYFYDNRVCDFAKNLTPSARGELEITDLNKIYLAKGLLDMQILDKSYVWLDTGTHESMLEASKFVHEIEQKTGKKLACVEEIACKEGFIDDSEILKSIEKYNNDYCNYVRKALEKQICSRI
ncbi:glucose-1-phosphate thymidylyltransferase RfbA [bacterium]|nr:glucose-1-phosphate thymidylyltransferase RfbA [bacterium]